MSTKYNEDDIIDSDNSTSKITHVRNKNEKTKIEIIKSWFLHQKLIYRILKFLVLPIFFIFIIILILKHLYKKNIKYYYNEKMSNDKVKYLVTGGAGFIGTNLILKLVNEGYSIICINKPSKNKNLEIIKKLKNTKIYLIDVCDTEALIKIIKRENIIGIFHLASFVGISNENSNLYQVFRDTIYATMSVLKAMQETNVKRLFFASTSNIYGYKKGVVFDEEYKEVLPQSLYAFSKLYSEKLISAYAKANNFTIVIFRIGNTLGSPYSSRNIVFDFVKKLKKNPKELLIYGDGNQSKPFMYISDLIDAIYHIINIKTNNNVNIYNVGVETQLSVKEIADLCCQKLNLKNIKYIYTGGSSGWKGDIPNYKFSINKILKTGWKPKYNSAEAVQKAVDDLITSKKMII